MSKFKVGNRVVRTRHLEQNPSRGWPTFQEGRPYLVTNVSLAGWLGIAELNEHPTAYDPDCFELYVEPAYVPKLGDRVVTTESCTSLCQAGAMGVVVELATDGTVKVKFVDGGFNTQLNTTIGGVWVFTNNLKLAEAAYSSSFTKPTTPDATPKGHTNDGGGLQNHSVGGAYPWAVVAYDDKTHGTRYTVENVKTGEVVSWQDETGKKYPTGWYLAANATKYLQAMLKTGSGKLLVKGRPVFNGSTLSFAKPKTDKVQEAQDAMVAAVMAYHAALQSDIG